MSISLGSGVSRTLELAQRQFSQIVWRARKPPLDSEWNALGQMDVERLAAQVRAEMPSGFLMNITRPQDDYQTSSLYSNMFVLGAPKEVIGVTESDEMNPVLWANVNGWLVPVTGTDFDGVENVVKLYPPPETDSRVDFVFLEVWQSVVRANPSTTNKPSANTFYPYGNTMSGQTGLTDDLVDPEIRFETTARVQLQYRLRTYGAGAGLGAGVNLDVYPEGLGDPNILGQGNSSSPVGGLIFANMREELGDPGLWRAGDGDPNNDLRTVDGYVYAIPVCAIFRRNSSVYVSVSNAGNPNQNGAFNRNPGASYVADPTSLSRELSQATLGSFLSPTDGVSLPAVVYINNLNGCGLEDTYLNLSSTFLQIEDEIVGVSAVDLVGGTITIPAGGRGRYGTAAVGHNASTSKVKFWTTHPDGLFSDEVAKSDILDLRHAVQPGVWDHTQLLAANVGALIKGDLKTTWKSSASGDTEGVVVREVDYLLADGGTAVPNQTEALDGPDGIRTIWSDAAVIQSDVTVLLDNEATTDNNNVGLTTSDQFDTTVTWDVGADFRPTGFLNLGPTLTQAFTNGSSIFLHISGEDGEGGARATFRAAGTKAVRFATPQEMWKSGYPLSNPDTGNQHPVTIRFLDSRSQEPSPTSSSISVDKHPGPMYPWKFRTESYLPVLGTEQWNPYFNANFESPFIVLGGLVHPGLYQSVATSSLSNSGITFQVDVGTDFDTSGIFYTLTGNGDFSLDASLVSYPMLRGERTFFDLITNGGKDRSGLSSELYIVMYGDKDSTQNNGAFRVIGAGTVGYTTWNADNSTSLVVVPLSADFDPNVGFENATGNILTVEWRTQYHNSEDISDYASRKADLAIVLTDIGGIGSHPWNKDTLGEGSGYDNSFYPVNGVTGKIAVTQKLLVSTTLLYHPGRGATARVADKIAQIALKGGANYLSRNPGDVDTTFSSAAGTQDDERYFPTNHIQVWNRLSSKGLHAPEATKYGGDVVGYVEVEREAQAFVDAGSKSLVFRPFRNREMTLHTLSFDSVLAANECLLGSYDYPSGDFKDPLHLWTGTPSSGKQMGVAVPREYMPRFGRQDIPFYKDTESGQGTFLNGINHLFTDAADVTNPVFNIIGGGDDNTTGGNKVTLMHFVTGTPTNYGVSDTVIGAVLNTPNIEARKTTDIDTSNAEGAAIVAALNQINSSDLGRGLKGIQLPPYYGPARIIGVYEKSDFEAKSGRTVKANRYEVEVNPATNLIREDAQKQTLYILQDGAKDLTGSSGDHTYIVPSNVLDLTRIPGYVTGQAFEDFDYVVVCTIFGFARDWINGNNYVLVRKHNGSGVLRTDGTSYEFLPPMTIPCAAGLNDAVYIAYNRTAYQGDVYGTRFGSTRTMSDYEHRYGQISMSNQAELMTAIQQYYADGSGPVPQVTNPRAFEVLASMDFATTLGTGKIGGELQPGTVLDVGYTDVSGYERMGGSNPWRIQPRAFTEGQVKNSSRASTQLEIADASSICNANAYGDAFEIDFTLLDDSKVSLFFSQSSFDATITGAGYESQDIIRTYVSSETLDNYPLGSRTHVVSKTGVNFGTLSPGDAYATSTQNGWTVVPLITSTAVVSVNPKADYGNDMGRVIFTGRMSNYASGQVKVDAIYQPYWPNFMPQDLMSGGMVRTFSVDFPLCASGATVTSVAPISWTGVTLTNKSIVLVSLDTPGLDNYIFTGYVSGADQITLQFYNNSGLAVDLPSATYRVCVLEDVDPTAYAIDLSNVDLEISVSYQKPSEYQIADSLVQTINSHTKLNRTVTASREGTVVTITAVPPGTEGNAIKVAIWKKDFAVIASTLTVQPMASVLKFLSQHPGNYPVTAKVTSVNLSGGIDGFYNAGSGTTQLKMTGLTERLPLGILLQDSDFIGENPARDNSSALVGVSSKVTPAQTLLPLATNGLEYTRFLGVPGEIVGFSDGGILDYAAYTTATPTGSKKFRIFRGGGSIYVLSGDIPGGPVEWSADDWAPSLHPVLKGGVLLCRAMLVRSFREEAFNTHTKTSDGDELQLLVLTYGILGDGNSVETGINLSGEISPTGYGEGYAAADRYRIMGRPLMKGYTRKFPNPSITLTVYPEDKR